MPATAAISIRCCAIASRRRLRPAITPRRSISSPSSLRWERARPPRRRAGYTRALPSAFWRWMRIASTDAHSDEMSSAFRFSHGLRVRWAEVDRQGIVFNGHYFTYFDVAITEYWRAIGYPYPDALLAAGSDTFVVKTSIEYHAPAHYDDMLDVL